MVNVLQMAVKGEEVREVEATGHEQNALKTSTRMKGGVHRGADLRWIYYYICTVCTSEDKGRNLVLGLCMTCRIYRTAEYIVQQSILFIEKYIVLQNIFHTPQHIGICSRTICTL
jgi:hypothetical protein